jgi:hypothetical protein
LRLVNLSILWVDILRVDILWVEMPGRKSQRATQLRVALKEQLITKNDQAIFSKRSAGMPQMGQFPSSGPSCVNPQTGQT